MKVAQRTCSKFRVNLDQAITTGTSSLEGIMQPKHYLFCNEEGQKQNILGGIIGRSTGYTHRVI